MLSRPFASGGVVGSSKAVWAVKRVPAEEIGVEHLEDHRLAPRHLREVEEAVLRAVGDVVGLPGAVLVAPLIGDEAELGDRPSVGTSRAARIRPGARSSARSGRSRSGPRALPRPPRAAGSRVHAAAPSARCSRCGPRARSRAPSVRRAWTCPPCARCGRRPAPAWRRIRPLSAPPSPGSRRGGFPPRRRNPASSSGARRG